MYKHIEYFSWCHREKLPSLSLQDNKLLLEWPAGTSNRLDTDTANVAIKNKAIANCNTLRTEMTRSAPVKERVIDVDDADSYEDVTEEMRYPIAAASNIQTTQARINQQNLNKTTTDQLSEVSHAWKYDDDQESTKQDYYESYEPQAMHDTGIDADKTVISSISKKKESLASKKESTAIYELSKLINTKSGEREISPTQSRRREKLPLPRGSRNPVSKSDSPLSKRHAHHRKMTDGQKSPHLGSAATVRLDKDQKSSLASTWNTKSPGDIPKPPKQPVPPLSITRKQKGRTKVIHKTDKTSGGDSLPDVASTRVNVLQELSRRQGEGRQNESSPVAESEYYSIKGEFGSDIIDNRDYKTPMYDTLNRDDQEFDSDYIY